MTQRELSQEAARSLLRFLKENRDYQLQVDRLKNSYPNIDLVATEIHLLTRRREPLKVGDLEISSLGNYLTLLENSDPRAIAHYDESVRLFRQEE